ncbi:DUF637 domain-containing protein, partial [Nitratifractor sp.]
LFIVWWSLFASFYASKTDRQQAAHSALQAGVGTAVYGGDFAQAFANSLGTAATDALYYEVGNGAADLELVQNNDAFSEGGIDKALMHSAAGAVGAALTGGDVASGAAGAFVRELTAPLSADASAQTQDAISYLTGGLTGLITGGEKGAFTGANIALSAEQNNRQLHQKKIAWIEEHAAEFAERNGLNPEDARA